MNYPTAAGLIAADRAHRPRRKPTLGQSAKVVTAITEMAGAGD